MTQLSLFATVRHHCEQCAAEVEAAIEYMRLARLRGEYDAEGYRLKNGRRCER